MKPTKAKVVDSNSSPPLRHFHLPKPPEKTTNNTFPVVIDSLYSRQKKIPYIYIYIYIKKKNIYSFRQSEGHSPRSTNSRLGLAKRPAAPEEEAGALKAACGRARLRGQNVHIAAVPQRARENGRLCHASRDAKNACDVGVRREGGVICARNTRSSAHPIDNVPFWHSARMISGHPLMVSGHPGGGGVGSFDVHANQLARVGGW